MSLSPTDNGDLTNNQLRFAFYIIHYVLQVICGTDEFDKMFFTLSWQMTDYDLLISQSLSVLHYNDQKKSKSNSEHLRLRGSRAVF